MWESGAPQLHGARSLCSLDPLGPRLVTVIGILIGSFILNRYMEVKCFHKVCEHLWHMIRSEEGIMGTPVSGPSDGSRGPTSGDCHLRCGMGPFTVGVRNSGSWCEKWTRLQGSARLQGVEPRPTRWVAGPWAGALALTAGKWRSQGSVNAHLASSTDPSPWALLQVPGGLTGLMDLRPGLFVTPSSEPCCTPLFPHPSETARPRSLCAGGPLGLQAPRQDTLGAQALASLGPAGTSPPRGTPAPPPSPKSEGPLCIPLRLLSTLLT